MTFRDNLCQKMSQNGDSWQYWANLLDMTCHEVSYNDKACIKIKSSLFGIDQIKFNQISQNSIRL